MQHIVCHVVWRNNSTINFDSSNLIHFCFVFLAEPLTDEGGEETGLSQENPDDKLQKTTPRRTHQRLRSQTGPEWPLYTTFDRFSHHTVNKWPLLSQQQRWTGTAKVHTRSWHPTPAQSGPCTPQRLTVSPRPTAAPCSRGSTIRCSGSLGWSPLCRQGRCVLAASQLPEILCLCRHKDGIQSLISVTKHPSVVSFSLFAVYYIQTEM